MKFKFDPNQEYQLEAIEAVTELFDGQPRAGGGMHFVPGTTGLAAVPNRLDLPEEDILRNLHAVQDEHGVSRDDELRCIETVIETAEGEKEARWYNFSVEMETGTGKTYVYLRTALELHRLYGMRKFIVVVPSLAIKEGVLKTLQVTEEHFRRLYHNPVYRYYEYSSENLSQVKQFASSDAIEMMVMTIDSFNKSKNVLRRDMDRFQGERPIHAIQTARPILILDEPQNMESKKSRAALSLLNPLFALRYSATHRVPYNVVHRLTPAAAYEQGLVKKIQVASVVREDDANPPFIRVEELRTSKKTIRARVSIHRLLSTGRVKEKTYTFAPGDDLHEKARLPVYEGYVIDEISPGAGYITFSNNVELQEGEEFGTDKEAIFEAQIRTTVREHLDRQERLRPHGIKVLSLFFIDRVDNYREGGVIRRMFDRIYAEESAAYDEWADLEPQAVQAAYFACQRRQSGQVELMDSKTGESQRDEDAYDLIMRDKEALLSFPDPADDEETRRKKQVSFIFSHSALREGWDNPNVFQICTLNQTASPIKKRQEIGRGVRLPVDQTGDRIRDEGINILTVVANESYATYVSQLQSEIAEEYRDEIESRMGKKLSDLTDEERADLAEEYGEDIIPPKPRKAGQGKARLRKERVLSPQFKSLWERIKHKTRYAVRIDREALLEEVMPELNTAPIAAPRVKVEKASVEVTDDGFDALQMGRAKTLVDLSGRYPVPNLVDLMMEMMENTTPPMRLTKNTLLEVFKRATNKQAALDNPHEWASTAVRILKSKLADHLIEGIQYEKEGGWYEMSQLLGEEEVEIFSRYVAEPDPGSDKAIYDRIPCDSQAEQQFVTHLEARKDVRLYVKLPAWFTVPTPVGDYNPDWAVLLEEEGEETLYFVAETKGIEKMSGHLTRDEIKDQVRPEEWRKIRCGAAHFGSEQLDKEGALEDVDYRVVSEAEELP